MKTVCPEKPAWLATGLRIICLVIIVLLLLPGLSPVQFAWPSGVPPSSPGSASEVRPGSPTPPGLRAAAFAPENLARHRAGPLAASLPASGIYQDVTVRPAILGRLPRGCPLPPASVFPLQTNLRQYLETWPTPGSTTTEAWPDYLPEDGEDVD